MAGRNYRNNRIYNWHVFPVQLDAQISIAGTAGAPTLVTSSTITGSSPTATTQQSMGIKSITRLAAGQYQIQLDDNYVSLLNFSANFSCPVTGSSVAGGSFVTATVYQILTLGTTTQAQWVTAGVPSGVTAAIGVVFKAAGAGAGSGTVKALTGPTADYQVAIMGSPDLMLNNQPFTQGGGGGYINFMTVGPKTPGTSSADAAPTAKDPDDGTVMYVKVLLSNSSIS